MAQPFSSLRSEIAVARTQSGLRSAMMWGCTGLLGLLLAAAAVLWFHYGTAVSFETIAAGFTNCF